MKHRSAGIQYSPALYAAVHTGNQGDVAFYAEACRGARSVLELGCGSGRVTSVLAATGAAVVGLDRDWRALQFATSPCFLRVCADMARFALAMRFERIVIPYNGLCCLLARESLIACLQRAGEHLGANGRIVFDVYNADGMELWPAAPPPSETELGEFRVAGERWTVTEHSTVKLASQRVDATYTHRRLSDGHTEIATIAQRYLLSREMPELLDAAGLAMASVHGGFRGEPFDETSPQLVVTAVRR